MLAPTAYSGLRDVRLFSESAPSELVDISRDGRLVAFVRVVGEDVYQVGVVDLQSQRSRVLATEHAAAGRLEVVLASEISPIQLSPTGRWLSLTRGNLVLAVDTTTGAMRRIGWATARDGLTWLNDGRLAFFDSHGSLVAARVGGRTEVLVRRVLRGPSAPPTVSPDGRYVLFARNCSVWLLDRRSGTTRNVAPVWRERPSGASNDRFGRAPGVWSPDSRHYFVTNGSWGYRCTVFSHGLDNSGRVRDVSGHDLLDSPGGWPSWGADGKVLLLNGGATGMAISYEQPLYVFDLRTRRTTLLLHGRLAGTAWAGPGGWVLYDRYDAAAVGADPGRTHVPDRLYLGRIGAP
jgi:WD40 repeat protein